MTMIFEDELASRLDTTVDGIYDLARLGRLPFVVSSASPRRLAIAAEHLGLWRDAARTAGCNT
jgi:hypothetical protein